MARRRYIVLSVDVIISKIMTKTKVTSIYTETEQRSALPFRNSDFSDSKV